jgi:hypothetical protein
MATQSTPPGPEPNKLALQLDAEKVLDFIRDQNKADREYFDKLLKWFGIGIGVTVAAIGVFGIQNYNQIKQIRAEIIGEARNQLAAAVKAELSQQKMQEQINVALREITQSDFQTAMNNALAAELDKPDRKKLITEAVNRQIAMRMVPRKLSDSQKDVIMNTLTGNPPSMLQVQSGAPQEQRDYARELCLAIVRSPSWKERVVCVNGTTYNFMGIEFDGILLMVADPKRLSASEVLLESALRKAGVAGLKIGQLPHDRDPKDHGPVLYVGGKLF